MRKSTLSSKGHSFSKTLVKKHPNQGESWFTNQLVDISSMSWILWSGIKFSEIIIIFLCCILYLPREPILVRSKVFPSNYLLFPTFSSMAQYTFDQSSKEDFLLNYFIICPDCVLIWLSWQFQTKRLKYKIVRQSSSSLSLPLKNLSSVV